MKLINNQDTQLIAEIQENINNSSTIYICCNHFTVFGIFELIKILSTVKEVKILIDNNLDDENEFTFLQSNIEKQLNNALNRQYKTNQVIKFIKDKLKIRRGSIGNQNVLIVENNNVSICYTLTPLNLDSISLGTLPSPNPVFINSFDDTNNQYRILNQAQRIYNKDVRIYNYSSFSG